MPRSAIQGTPLGLQIALNHTQDSARNHKLQTEISVRKGRK